MKKNIVSGTFCAPLHRLRQASTYTIEMAFEGETGASEGGLSLETPAPSNRDWTNTYFFSGGFAVKCSLWSAAEKRRLGSDSGTALFTIRTFDFRYSSCCCDYRKEREVMRMERFVAEGQGGSGEQGGGECRRESVRARKILAAGSQSVGMESSEPAAGGRNRKFRTVY